MPDGRPALKREDGSWRCPICEDGTLYGHDIGYDECDNCDFFAIYDDGRRIPRWSDAELEKEYRTAEEEYKEAMLKEFEVNFNEICGTEADSQDVGQDPSLPPPNPDGTLECRE